MRTPGAGRLLAVVAVVLLFGCGEAPLQSIGLRSSDWINEPTVPTTIAVVTTTPTVVPATRLSWANEEIASANLGERDAVLADVFARREGDRFIQASAGEIVTALPDARFPGLAPAGAQWVSSQLVFDNDGSIADDPSAAFGIWSAEPYTRSRSVAQMVVIRLSNDPEAAAEVASGETEPTCARFSDEGTDECEVITLGQKPIWVLGGSGGHTLVWFEGSYRYEMFGRSFVPSAVLQEMSNGMMPLASLVEQSS